MEAVPLKKLFIPIYKRNCWSKEGTRTENSKPVSMQAEAGYGNETAVLYVMCQSANVHETEGI